MTLGFDKPLYVLSFDYRAPVLSMIGAEEILSDHHTAEIDFAMSEILLGKHLVYDGFEAALATGVPKQRAAILVDERFGEDFLRAANARGYLTACPVEKCGQDEFEFEYGEEFAAHIENLRPTFCRAQVRYNPEANINDELNRRQLHRLQRLSDYLHTGNNSLLMLELLVPAEKDQLARVDGEEKAYHLEVRPQLAAEAIRQLQDAQVEPDIWSIEAVDRAADYEKIVDAVHRKGRDRVGCVVLVEGQSDDEEEVRQRLAIAAGVPGVTGFAAGRRIFWEPLANWLAKSITAQSAAGQIAEHFLEFVGIFEEGPKRMAA